MCKKTKKIISFFLTASMLLSLSGVPAFASSNPSSWAVEEINEAKAEGLVTNSVMKDYQANITREQFCEMVVRAYEKISGEKATVGNMYFSDTSNVEISKAANLGIVTGYGSNVFGPNDLITREQIAAMLVRMIDKSVSYANINIYNNNKFNDVDYISQWAIPSVNFAYDKGIMQGVGNNCIDPQANTTCEQAILLVHRSYKSNSENNEYVFNDSAFEYSVRRAIAYKLHQEWGSTYDKQLTADLLNQITSLILYDIPNGEKLTDISDIDKLKNLQLIEFENDINNITNLELISDSEIKFDDFAFELCVRMSLPRGDRNDDGSIYIGRITDEMLKRITELSTSHLPNAVRLESLEDLVLTPNLVDLRLDPDHIEITDFSNIVNMQHLECLMLSGVEIENDKFLYDLDISGLIDFPNSTNLFFDLGDNIDYREALNVYETVKKKMNQLGTQIDVAKTDYEKYKIIHDYLIKNMEYDYDFVWQAIDNGFDDLYLSLYIGKGICSVYANTYQYLCEYFGLDCWTVYGDAKGIIYEGDTPSWGEHAWNIVKIDNNYYHVDVTWDDPLGDATLRYDYFLISDKRISKDHKWNDSEYGTNMFGEDEREIPLCSYDFEHKSSGGEFVDEDFSDESSNNISFDDDEDEVIGGISYNVEEIIDLAVSELSVPEQVGICITVSSPEYNAELQEYIIWIEFYENETDLDNGDVKA